MRFIREDSDEVEGRLVSHSERARLSHERWLNRALERERLGHALPTIPTRAEREGGFSRLMSTALGRAWAYAWWEGTLGSLEAEF